MTCRRCGEIERVCRCYPTAATTTLRRPEGVTLYVDIPATPTSPRIVSSRCLDGLALTDAIAEALAHRVDGAVVAITQRGVTLRRVYLDGAWRCA
jgi:hypothetical protein